MKINIFKIAVLATLLGLSACSKNNDNLDIDLSEYNYDDFHRSEVDDYIYNTLTKPYNIEVVYRFDRSHTDISKNISPPKIDRIKPAVDMVLKGFLLPYEKLGGSAMIKTYTPKQFVLFGSHAYNDNGSVTLGTADGGRRVVLYDINNLDEENGNDIKRKLRTIHHEFTHILNQMVAIPPSFRTVTADHVDNWLAAENTDAEAKRLGFVSRYARSNYGEDFAEMVAHLLVEGQVWFDNYVSTIEDPVYKGRIRQKEAIVREYYKSYFNIDFGLLQEEIHRILTEDYNATFPEDMSSTLPVWISSNKVNTITFTPDADHYTTYGISTGFNTMWTNFYNAVATQTPTGERRYMKNLELQFTSASTMTIGVGYSSSASDPSIGFYANYDFNFEVDLSTSEIKFSKKLPEGTSGSHNNGALSRFKPFFEQYMLPYFTNRVFVLDWLPTGITSDNPQYKTFGGFYEKGNPSNYFYGPIVLK